MCDACETARKVLQLLAEEAASRGYDVAQVKRYDSEGEYGNAITNAAKQFWKDGSKGGFKTRMGEIVRFGLKSAFNLGAESVGIPEEELNDQELALRDEIIAQELSHVADLLAGLDEEANNPGGSLANLLNRLSLWAARWTDVYNRAKVLVGKDEKLEWVYGDTEHCNSCLKLNGIVKRASFWDKAGVTPRNPPNPNLTCGGWKCQCTLEPTTKPVRRGRLPGLP